MRKEEMGRLLALQQAEKACIRLLSKDGDFGAHLQNVLDICLGATGVSRVYVFENEDDPMQGVCITQVCEACAEGVAPQIGNPELRHLPYAEGAPKLLARLQAHESYARVVSDLDGPEREILDAQHVLSILIEPVFVGHSLWGFIGFDDCETARAWQDEEIQILQAVADAVGVAVSRQQQRRDIERRIAFERMVAVVCSRLAQADGSAMDDVVNAALEDIGRFVGADRAYLFQFRNGNARMDNTHEWCAEGIEPQIDTLQDIALAEELPWFAGQIQKGEAVHIPCVADLPHEAGLERRHFEQQGIQSLIAVPMKTAGRLAGFLGFDAVKTAQAWAEDDRMLLGFVAETMAGTLQRIRQENLLHAQREAQAILLNNIQTQVWYLTDEHTYGEVNTAHAEFNGVRVQDLAFRDMYEIFPRDVVEVCRQSNREVFRSGRVRHTEEWVPHASGEQRLIAITKAPTLRRDGTVACVVCSAEDITERKRAEKELGYNLALVTSLLNSIPDIVFFKTDEGVYLGCNEEFARHVGRTQEEIVGKTDYDLYDKETADTFRANDRLMMERGTPRHNEEWIDYPDGRRILLDTLKAPLVSTDGERIGLLGVSRDITKQREAEAQLRLQSLVFNQIQDCVTVTDLNGVITYINDAEVRALGYSRDELIGVSTEKYGEDAECGATQRQILEETIKHGKWRGEVVNRTANGEEVILDCRTQVVLDEEGNRIGLAGIATDITERKRAEEALQESEARHMSMVANISDVIAIIGVDGFMTYKSPNVEKWFGWKPQDLVGADGWLTVHPDDLERVKKEFNTLLETDKSVSTVEYRYKCKEGHYTWIELTATNLIHDPLIDGVLLNYHDITERKRAEEALRASEAQHRLLIQHLHTAVVVHAADTQIILANKQASQLLGLSLDQMTGKIASDPVWRFVREDETVMLFEEYPVQRVLTTRQPIHGLMMGIDHPAKEDRIWALVNAFPEMDADGQLRQVVVTFIDVTERKRMEQERLEMERQIQHTQKLESLGVLAGGIAHDFNNLLMSILGHADLALDELTPTSPARANIEQIETASRRAADLCAQMLAYSGRGRFIIEAFDVSTLIEEMAHLLRTSISKKAILNLQVEKNLPKVQGDATQIRQVIMNLVINASEAIGERSGVISVTTGACQCHGEDLQGAYFEEPRAEGLYVVVEVTDTGCGMDQETLDRLFEPFFTTKFTGRGLGMSAVLGIVRGHKGILKVNSERGKGTTFRILLPPSEDTDSDTTCEQQAVSGMSASNARVLLVEDEESVRALGQKMLERIGFQVTTASDGRQAVEVYGREGKMIDLVVLDLTMPHMDGEEALRELKQIDPEVRIVMASGYSNHEIEARLAGQGLLGFIQKPYTMAQLKERLYPLFEK